MNILPKKSWHVRTKKNIERVRRDEEKAAAEEKERQRRIDLAEQEARTELLRDRNRKRQHDHSALSSSPAVEGSSGPAKKVVKSSTDILLNQRGHINFFRDIEEGLCHEGQNKEHEAERAAEKEKWEKNVGLLTYLGQSSIESQSDKPWYLQQSKSKKARSCELKQIERQGKDQKLKDSMDPLKDMKRLLEKRHHHKDQGRGKHRSHSLQKTHGKHGSSSPVKQSSASCPSISTSPQTKIEQLRAKRLQREMMEKQKIAAVMAKAHGETSTVAIDNHLSDLDMDRARGYNSQYNPGFVKPVACHKR